MQTPRCTLLSRAVRATAWVPSHVSPCFYNRPIKPQNTFTRGCYGGYPLSLGQYIYIYTVNIDKKVQIWIVFGIFFLSFIYGFPDVSEHPRRVRVVVASLPRPPDVPARRYVCANASPACPARPKPLTNPVRDPYPAWSAGAPTPKNLEKK